jgi:hypothetical protein
MVNAPTSKATSKFQVTMLKGAREEAGLKPVKW